MTTSSATIDSLPLECLALVSDNLKTVQELSIQRKVSPPFQAVAEKLLLSFRTLKYFPNAGRLFDYLDVLMEHNLLDEANYRLDGQTGADFYLDDFKDDEQTLAQPFPLWLSRVMRNVTDLVLVLKRGPNYDLDQFLAPWASQLESLTLVGNSTGYEPLSCQTLSKMLSLRRLNLFNFDLAHLDTTQLAPVLSRLSHLGLYGYREPAGAIAVGQTAPLPDRVTPFLAQLSPGITQSLSLSGLTWPLTYLEALAKNKGELFAGLKALHLSCQEDGTLEYAGMSSRALQLIVKAAPGLTCLQTSGGSTLTQTFNHILASVSPLSCLTTLRLFFTQPLGIGFLSNQPSLPNLRHLQLHLSPSGPEEDTEPFSNLTRFLTLNCPSLQSLTLLTDRPLPWATEFGAVCLSNYQVTTVEESFLSERHLAAIFAYQLGAIERELALFFHPKRVSSVCQGSSALPVDAFFRGLSVTRLDEHSSTLAQRAYRRNVLASLLNACKHTASRSASQLQAQLADALLANTAEARREGLLAGPLISEAFDFPRERLLLDRFDPQRLRQWLLGWKAISQFDGSSGSGLFEPDSVEASYREAVSPFLGQFLRFLKLTNTVTAESSSSSQDPLLEHFYAHYKVDWPVFMCCLAEECKAHEITVVQAFDKFDERRSVVGGVPPTATTYQRIPFWEIPSPEQLVVGSCRSYLATRKVTNWLHSLMSAMLKQLKKAEKQIRKRK